MKSFIAKLAVLVLPALILASACNKQEIDPIGGSSSVVKFVIGGSSSQTKAASANQQQAITCEPIDLSEESGIEGLRLSEEISSLDDYLYNVPATKGTPVFTENLSQIYDKLLVNAYKGTTNNNK